MKVKNYTENTTFEHLGWFLEFMMEGVGTSIFLGTAPIEEPDRDEVGYYSRQDHVAEQDIVFKNDKVVRKGETYFTRLYPLCGRAIKKFNNFE